MTTTSAQITMEEIWRATFQPSLALRWVRRMERVRDVSFEVTVLQQEWVNPYTGEREWRDVPTVEEEVEE